MCVNDRRSPTIIGEELWGRAELRVARSRGGGVWRTEGGGNKHANRKPVKPGGRGGTSPSRRRSLRPVEALGGAEDLEGGEQRSQDSP